MAICILVLEQEETVFELWENIKNFPTQIRRSQVIEPISKKSQDSMRSERQTKSDIFEIVKFKNVKLLNPKLSRKERQKQMALWLMPFGFIAGLTFSGMTNLQTFSNLGFGQSGETVIGGLLGMVSGWIGSFFGARSVNSSQEDIKSLLKFNEKGLWLILMETPYETELPWKLIREIKPVEIINLNLD